MALTPKERMQRYRSRVKRGELVRTDVILPLETAKKLEYLVDAWGCTKVEALAKLIDDGWTAAGEPTPGPKPRKTKKAA